MIDVGKYTSPMDPHGILDPCFFLSLSSRDLRALNFTQNSSNRQNSRQASLQPSSPQKISKKSLQNFTQNHHSLNNPKKESEEHFFCRKKKNLNFRVVSLKTSGRCRGGHVQSTNAGLFGEGLARERIEPFR